MACWNGVCSGHQIETLFPARLPPLAVALVSKGLKLPCTVPTPAHDSEYRDSRAMLQIQGLGGRPLLRAWFCVCHLNSVRKQ